MDSILIRFIRLICYKNSLHRAFPGDDVKNFFADKNGKLCYP